MGQRGVPPIQPPREAVDELVRRYRAGERLVDLAAWLGVGRTTVSRILADEGEPRRDPPHGGGYPSAVPREDHARIAAEYASTPVAATEIAARYGVSGSRIRAIIAATDPEAPRKHREAVERAIYARANSA